MLFRNRAVCLLGAFSLVVQFLAPTSALAQNVVGGQAPLTGLKLAPRAALSSLSLANSVTLNSTSYTTLLQGLKIKRQIPFASIKSNRVVQIGDMRLNMTPLLENPKSLPNVAQKLRSIPALVQAVADDTQIHEVEQGLLIHHVMSYQIKHGVCNDTAQRVQLVQTGVHCATQLNDISRAFAFANKGDAHYVADPIKREQKLALAKQQSESARATIDQYAADFRVTLKDPAQRAKIDAEIGPATAAKLDALNDDQLKTELINTGETKIEQTMFVPKTEALNATLFKKFNLIEPAPHHLPKINQDVVISHDLPPFVFLTGFTLGRDYEIGRAHV